MGGEFFPAHFFAGEGDSGRAGFFLLDSFGVNLYK